MELLIVRHAIAMERDAKRWPDDRLSARCRPAASRAPARPPPACKRLAGAPRRVLASPLLRAQQTAAHPHRALCPLARGASRVPSSRPAARREALLALPRAHAGGPRIAVVGHEPAARARCWRVSLPGSSRRRAFALRKMGAALLRFRGRGAGRQRAARVVRAAEAAARARVSLARLVCARGGGAGPAPPRCGRASQTSPISAMKMIPET